jgi:hypothetical protein
VRRIIVLGAAWLTLLAAAAGSASAAPPPEGLTWGGRHFGDRAAFAHWLGGHNIDYSAWARRHPLGAYLLTHSAPPPLVPAPATQPVAPVAVPATRHGPTAPEALTLVAVALLLGFGLAGGAVSRLAPATFGTVDLSGARVGATAGGVSILVGVLVAHWL